MIDAVTSSFQKQGLMTTLGAKLVSVEKGKVVIECSRNQGLTQQHGYFHAGVLTAIADSVCGYAALTMMPEGKEVLTVEFKVNFLRPANTNKIIAEGNVVHSGKTLTLCEGEVFDESGSKLLAKMTATIITR